MTSRYSLLDLAPITQGSTVSQALEASRQMAIHAEKLGYQRIWLAEHHGMPGIASSATALVISHVAAATKQIRVGAGGIMLPNHPPLVIAEQFGTLEALYPGRIDLGLGRAPGSDMATAKALRRDLNNSVDRYPADIKELQHWLGKPDTNQSIAAYPGANSHVPLWLLGSSLYSAELAAKMGLPYSFASHFAPDLLHQALALYHQQFTPSEQQATPYLSTGLMAILADSDEEATLLASSLQQQFIHLRRGTPGTFPPPVQDITAIASAAEIQMVNHVLQYALIGTVESVQQKLQDFLRHTQSDEVILSMPIYDLDARLHSLELAAQLFNQG